jgi:signal transduction histidine kinase
MASRRQRLSIHSSRSATPRRPGLGLVSLGERVRMLGGELEVATQPDAGTRIAVHLPAADARAS